MSIPKLSTAAQTNIENRPLPFCPKLAWFGKTDIMRLASFHHFVLLSVFPLNSLREFGKKAAASIASWRRSR